MYLMYIDESGDTIPLTQKGKKFLVLTGAVIHEAEIPKIEEQFRAIKDKYYQDPDVEIKSNFLRYANPDLSEDSPIKLNDRQKYDELEKEMANFCKEILVTLLSVVIDKTGFWQQFPAQNPYDQAYILLLERFQKYLEEQNGLGICIIDPREGQVEKSFIGQDLDRIHNRLRFEESELGRKIPNVVERLLFSTSDKTIGIQIADLFCYPIYHMFEYDKKPGEYWRYDELSEAKLYNKDEESGLSFFPPDTKKDLRFFS